MLFSVIIPTYNRASFLPKTIESFLNQSYQDFEIIIVDDGSTDNTKEVVAPFLSERIRYYIKDNEERAAARNFGTKKAKGEFVNWFDSDDYALSNHLEKASFFSPGKEVFHLGYKMELPNGTVINNVNNLPSNATSILHYGNPFSCNGIFVKREVALANPFNETRSLSASEDFELWLRLGIKYPIHCDNSITSVIVQHENRSVLTMTNSSNLQNRYNTFIEIISNNSEIQKGIGRNLDFLIMKNYLWLSVELGSNGYKKNSWLYLKKAQSHSWRLVFQRSFYAIIKHLLFAKNKSKE